MNDYQISKLKKQLQRKQELLKEQREDREHSERRLIEVQAQRDRFHGELVIARQTIQNVDQMIAQNVRQMKAKLEQQNAQSFNELQRLKDKILEEKVLGEKLQEEIKNKDTVISQLSLRLKEMARKYKDNSVLVSVKDISEQAVITNNQFYKLTQKYNKLCSDMDNIMAENKILRKLHGVPDNFGFDLEQIKIAQKQELEDYKAQCRKLQSEIQQLEGERTQLRYRLRQYNTLYSNKDGRYKDMTIDQLDMLDKYAMNLKEGKDQLPQIDKSQKEMERQIIKLRAQIEILQTRGGTGIIQPKIQGDQKMSVEALRKFQQQIKSMINPLVADMKRISQNSKVQVINENNQVDNRVSNTQINIENTRFKPPMPLPHSHNDWTHINEGYSYIYNSKIPIQLKDLNDELGFNIAKAKYEVAALQLQNIESLKLLKQRQLNEARLGDQLKELRLKYDKCLKVQDDLFMRYFKEKEQVSDKIRKLQIQNSNLKNQKQQIEAKHDIILQSYNVLSKNSGEKKQIDDLTTRLAISEAGMVKFSRKYEVLNDQHKMLKTSYTNLESKSVNNETSLKDKLARSKMYEKELIFYLNKILQDTKQAVSGDVHNALLGKMQSLNDKSVNASIRETELRLRINRLQNIEREINLKDDVIEALRSDNFDINLQLEIVRSRLEAIDQEYRAYRQVLDRLISFINTNNISVVTYFKKFDRNNSGQLNKDEFSSALKTLGFAISNNELQLLFSEFDLDGSQSITYKQFLRKLRRSGVLTRNKEEQMLYKLFRAIKQSNTSVKKAFQLIDMDGSKEISKSQMESALRKIGIEISMHTIDYMFKLCDEDLSGTISCNQFQKLFEDIIRQSAVEEKEAFNEDLDWKFAVILKIEECSNKYHHGLEQTFKTLDSDGNSTLTINQFSEFFKKAGIDIQRKDLLELFEFLDRHRDGKVEYIQFLKILDQAKKEKKRIDRLKFIKSRTLQLRKQNQLSGKEGQKYKATEQGSLKVRLMSLQTKHSSLIKKSQKFIKERVRLQQQINELKKEVEDNEKTISKLQDQYYKEKEEKVSLQQKIKNRVSLQQSKNLINQNTSMKVQILELSQENKLYKNLYQNLSTKNKYDEMRMVKIQSERDKSYDLVKQLQSLSDANAIAGAKMIQLQQSKRNEEMINKKYDNIIEQIRVITDDNKKLTEDNIEKERQIINIHIFLQQKSQLLQRNIDQLTSKILPTVNPHKIEEILSKIREISNSKSQLQKQNKELRELNYNIQVRNDYIENEKIHIEELQRKLRRTYTDESSQTIIEITKKLSQYKMGELKAKREAGLLKQKEEYYLRVNNSHTQNIKELQLQLSNWEIKFNQREDFWRQRLSSQMKLMQDLQKQAAKIKEQQRNAQNFFRQQDNQQKRMQKKFEALPQQKQLNISKMMMNSKVGQGNNQKVSELKQRIQQLEEELVKKQKEIYQLKSTLKQIVPEARFTDFGGQMGVSTNSFVMQTDLSSSQLKNNARRFINAQKQQQNYYKDEATRLTQAAQQSIDTLQRIIDDKNDQIKRKDQMLENLKKEFLKNKEEDCRQIQLLNQQIRQLKTKAQLNPINELMSKSTNKNFYPSNNNKSSDQVEMLRQQVQRKEQQIKNLQDKYDKLYISKDKKNNEINNQGQKVIQRKLNELQQERESQKRKYLQNQQELKIKIKNLEKLSKDKDLKLAKLQKTLIDLKNYAVNESVKLQENEIQEHLREALNNMNKGKSANDSKMEITLQKSLQAMQELSKKNKQYEHEIRRLKEEKLAKTTSFKK